MHDDAALHATSRSLHPSALLSNAHSDWALQSFSAASLLLLMLQIRFVPAPGSASQLPTKTMNRTFLVMGLGGLGLMGQVWVNGAFV